MEEIYLGDEYDLPLFKNFLSFLDSNNIEFKNLISGFGGSQEVEEYELLYKGGKCVLVRETYIGLVLRGDKKIVQGIYDEFLKQSKV